MTRRTAGLTLLAAGRLPAQSNQSTPTDEGRLNAFAGHYNRYVEQLRGGVIDLKQWGRVRRAWEALH